MKSWTKISGSTLLFAVLIGFAYGAPPLDVSEFFGTPVLSPEEAQTAPVPESKARLGSAPDLSELLAQLGGDQNNALRALATMLGNPQQPDSNEDANDLLSYFGQPDLEKEPEDIITDATVNCRTNSLSKADCEEHKQCHWLAKSKHEGKCIHQTERLYNALYKKLNKRGKKDIAIQVFYNSRPAKIKLPHGLHGPHIIGAFSHLQKLRHQYKPIGYNSHMNSYGYGGYNQPQGYGGYGGYKPQSYGGYSDPYAPPKEYKKPYGYSDPYAAPEPTEETTEEEVEGETEAPATYEEPAPYGGYKPTYGGYGSKPYGPPPPAPYGPPPPTYGGYGETYPPPA